MKNISFFKYALLFVASISLIGFNSCDPEEEGPPPILVEDGFYLKGTAAGLEELHIDGLMPAGRVEGPEFATLPREGMFEKFLYLTAGTFNLVQVSGVTATTWGWDGAGQQELVLDGTADQIAGTLYHGTIVQNGAAFTVVTPGLYHVVFDETTTRVFFTRITHWGAIGDATDLGWSGQYMMEESFANADSAKWEGTEIVIRARANAGVKFRYNSGWKISAPGDFIIFANIGNEAGNFVMGAGTFPTPAVEGVYTITLRWNSETGWRHTFTRTGDVAPLPVYPAELFMIGSAVGGWDWVLNGQPMVPVHSKPHLFWRIQWLEAGGEFKFAPQRAWAGDFGKAGAAPDANGIWARGADNIPIPAAGAGYYMVVVNLSTGHIAVVPPKVYLIGPTLNNVWDTANPAGLFTVDNANSLLTFTGVLTAGDLRMYAWFDAAPGWFTDWWQSEFIILGGNIVFRGTGDDQARVPVTAGNRTINLNFRALTGTIVTN